MISIEQSGDFKKTFSFFNKITKGVYAKAILDKYGKRGVDALSAATPKDTGETSRSWYYEIEKTKTGVKVTWSNSNVKSRVPIAILIQYGHGTGTGGYVYGRDYINPALQPVFDEMAKEMWREVTE